MNFTIVTIRQITCGQYMSCKRVREMHTKRTPTPSYIDLYIGREATIDFIHAKSARSARTKRLESGVLSVSSGTFHIGS